MSEQYFRFRGQSFAKSYCPSLSMKWRLTGFFICWGVALVLDILAWASLIGFLQGKNVTFAIFFSLSLLISILGSAFLVGFSRQLRSMFHKKRWITTSIFLLSLVLTLIFALVLVNPALTLISMVVELLAYAWYVISYVPFGQRIAKSLCGSFCLD